MRYNMIHWKEPECESKDMSLILSSSTYKAILSKLFIFSELSVLSSRKTEMISEAKLPPKILGWDLCFINWKSIIYVSAENMMWFRTFYLTGSCCRDTPIPNLAHSWSTHVVFPPQMIFGYTMLPFYNCDDPVAILIFSKSCWWFNFH